MPESDEKRAMRRFLLQLPIELKSNGFGKLLFGGGKLVGATLAGAEAAELIAPLGLAVANGLGKSEFNRWILAHPTLSEMVNPL